MSKPFFEVFPTLHLSEEDSALVSDAAVTRVSRNHAGTLIRVALTFPCPIGREDMKRLTRVMQEQLFAGTGISLFLTDVSDQTGGMVHHPAEEKKAVSKEKKKSSGQTAEKPTVKSRASAKASAKEKDPDLIFGRAFDGETMPIEQIDESVTEVIIRGQILQKPQMHKVRGEKTLILFAVTDFTDSVNVKIFVKNEQKDALFSELKKGAFVKIKGQVSMDGYSRELAVGGSVSIKKIKDFRTPRQDRSPQKRVELHAHTKMSEMDAVTDVSALIAQAKAFGMPAIAITDHGSVQAFPEAEAAAGDDIKVIYGVEAYLCDDEKETVTDSDERSLLGSFVVLDIETTGFSPEKDTIIEIGAVKVHEGALTDHFSAFVNPIRPIPYRIEKLTGIRDEMVCDAPPLTEVLPDFMRFCRGCAIVAHNADFDMSFIKKNCERQGIACAVPVVDTVSLARILLPDLKRYRLDAVAKRLDISLENHHRAVDDAEATAEIFIRFIGMLSDRGIKTLSGVNSLLHDDPAYVKKLPTYHAIILATCDQGKNNLYRLISESHLTYFAKRPRIPKSAFLRHRDGLLIGSGCQAGELYQAILGGRPEEEIARIVRFYDYLEIMPIENNAFLIDDPDSFITCEEDLRKINRQIVRLGEQFHKPVVAESDVHFLNPEDEIYRRIITAKKDFPDKAQPPLYLRTTEEMLSEFAYLGEEKAREVVIFNTNKIADFCEPIRAVRPDKCPPNIPDSDKRFRRICEERAHRMYGEVLPPIVEDRLNRELSSIIQNGYAMMYIIAQELVEKSNADGYLVGSRGSVGSSFAATMAGITEVNPLPPHYLCPNPDCRYSDFDSETVRSFADQSGCDLPDCRCPRCGSMMKKLGFHIPFETFLGFTGNKEPDIDLNFSGEYQSRAHKYTEVIFGKGQTYRAGTIGTMAEKTAYGYVKNYFEEHHMQKRTCEIDRIVSGCVGVRRTTGQHPGGIVVLPIGEEINTFTPVQYPANDASSGVITTHFDYHKIEKNLLKLDILGHDDPTMIRMLEDLTGVDPHDIPFDDKKVMALFSDTSSLNVTPEEIRGCRLGALGIPEFGTDFAMGMLLDTHPKQFSDLVRIAGLSHGTDVWLGNAQNLIKDGITDLSGCICTRDDIMLYLIEQGLSSEEAFAIMESVRRGRGLRPEWEEDMRDCGVPDWYIDSCKKIKYMFPKAHAAAYVMMAWRIAYWKVYYPPAFYAAYFSIRATGFSYEIMCQGKEKLEYFMDEYEAKKDRLSPREKDTYKDMRVVQEMYARGYSFTPIRLDRAQPLRFCIVDGKIMPSFSSIEGLGESAAVSITEAVKDGPFLSREDFRERTKVPKTIVDLMADLGILGDLAESNQLSLFDML